VTITIRTYTEADRPYVTSTWVSSLRSDRWTKEDRDLDPPLFSSRRLSQDGALVDRLLELEDIRILVTCSETDPHRIMGWLAYSEIRGGKSQPVLHFVYTRQPHRLAGHARRAMERAGFDRHHPLCVTFQTKALAAISRKHPSVVALEAEEFLK
jgi:hypothetical protein